jgi:putative oxidoreductase
MGVSIVFVVFGTIQFMNITPYLTNAAILKFVALTGNVAPPAAVAYLVATTCLLGGVFVLLGFKTRRAALVLCVFTALTIYFAHSFWDMEGPARAANQAHALKNLAIMGALLMLAVMGAGRYSIDHRTAGA